MYVLYYLQCKIHCIGHTYINTYSYLLCISPSVLKQCNAPIQNRNMTYKIGNLNMYCTMQTCIDSVLKLHLSTIPFFENVIGYI